MVTWGDSCQGGDSSRVTEQLRGVVALHSTRRAFAALKDTGEVVTWGTATEGGGSFMVSWQLLTVVSCRGVRSLGAFETSECELFFCKIVPKKTWKDI